MDDAPTLDVAGAVTVTASLMLAVYAIVNGNEAGWTSPATLGLLGAAVVLLVAFLVIESRVRRAADAAVAVPAAQRVGRQRRRGAVGRRHVRLVLHLGAVPAAGAGARARCEVGLAFLPANVIMAVCSLGISARLVMRFGIRGPLTAGLLLAAAGLLLFARAPAMGNVWLDVLPAMACSASAPASRSIRCCWRR